MADWADIANLWWLRPRNPGGQSSLPAFQLGAQMQQQRIQNDIEVKKMALDQQYRMDHLRTQDRMTTAQIENYQRIARERQDEEEDMIRLNGVMGDLAKDPTSVQFNAKTYRGREAFNQTVRAMEYSRTQRELKGAAQKEQLSFSRKLQSIKDYEPQAFAELQDEFESDGRFSPESIGRIDQLYKLHLGDIAAAPGGMKPKTLRYDLPGGGYVIYGEDIASRIERLPRATKDSILSLYQQRRAEISKNNVGMSPKETGYMAETPEQSMDYAEKMVGQAGAAVTPKAAVPPASSGPVFEFDPATKSLREVK